MCVSGFSSEILGMVRRHYHLIVSKYFILISKFALHFPALFSMFVNILITIKCLESGQKSRYGRET